MEEKEHAEAQDQANAATATLQAILMREAFLEACTCHGHEMTPIAVNEPPQLPIGNLPHRELVVSPHLRVTKQMHGELLLCVSYIVDD